MTSGSASKIARPFGAAWRTARNPGPSLPGFGHSGARRTAVRSRDLLERFASNAAHMPWIGRRQAVAHGLGTVRRRERAVWRKDGGKER